MRILQISNKAPYPANDGSSIAICNLAEGLADNNIELHLLSINTKKHFKPDDKIPSEFKEKTHYQSIFKNTNTTVLGALMNLFSSQSYFVSRFHFKEFEEALIQKLQSQTFDIVQLEGVFMASYIALIRKHSPAKIVLRTHNVEHQIWERHLKQEKNFIKKFYLSLQNKRLKHFELNSFNRVDAIVTITDDDKKNISEISQNKNIHTCLTGINLSSYKPVLNPAKPDSLFHFASMDWMPNIEAVDWLMSEVWPKVIAKQKNAVLVLAGRGMPHKFKSLSSANIRIIENVVSSEKFYNNYDIMLVPLWSGSGLRIKLVEGLAYGKAIVTTSIGAEGIPYTNYQDLIAADDANSFAKAIIDILQQTNTKHSLQQNARKLAEQHFDYKKLAADLILFYTTLTGTK